MNLTASKLWTSLLVFAAVLANAQRPAMPERSVIEEAPFIFKGTVRKGGASNLSALPAAHDTAIVRIDEILKSPDVLKAFAKRDITVKLTPGATLRTDQRALFLTSGWLYGESIAVKVIALGDADVDSHILATQIAQVEGSRNDRALAERMAASVSIVVAKVEEVGPLPVQDKVRFRSEHDPDFWRSEIEVTRVDKSGPRVGDRVTVFFAHSADELWLNAPKLSKGQEAIFLLQEVPADSLELRSVAKSGYVVIDALDVQPLQARDHLRSLLSGSKP